MTSARKRRLADDAARYVATGESDPMGMGEGRNVLDAMKAYGDELRGALLAEVRRRERGHRARRLPRSSASASFARQKLEPMVKGLFPAKEREIVLGVLERSIIFLTRKATHRLIQDVSFERTAWDIARIYLDSISAEPPGDEIGIVGMSVGTECYVSLSYFDDDDPFSDYVVHEAAHIFHNTKRLVVGLPHTRYREWMLDIAYRKREPFGYACEIYSRILEQGGRPQRRLSLLDEYSDGPMPSDKRVDADELVDILREAVGARNGWKRILARCSPPKS